jgi:glycogen synthase
MKTRILMFGWEFPPFNSGGLGVACQGLTRSLSERGFDVTFVMPKKLDVKTPYARFVFADDVKTVVSTVDNMRVRVIDSVLSPYLSEKRFFDEHNQSHHTNVMERKVYGGDLFAEVDRYGALGASIASEEKFDIIYAHDWLTFGPAVAAKYQSGKPLIVHIHATEFDRCGGRERMNQHIYDVEKWGMGEADCVVAISEYTKHVIVREYGIPEAKVRVVHNGIDEGTSPQKGTGWKRTRAMKDAGYKIVLFLGRITVQKGPDYFLRAAQIVIKWNPKVLFVVAGSGDMEVELMRLAAELGISKNVVFTGFLTGTDTHEMYSAADLFVMPSVSEPFGLAALEAMRLGTPALISKQSGVAEVVQHALKVNFWDIDEMANKILGVVGYNGLFQTLSENGREDAHRITWSDAAAKIDLIVHELVR